MHNYLLLSMPHMLIAWVLFLFAYERGQSFEQCGPPPQENKMKVHGYCNEIHTVPLLGASAGWVMDRGSFCKCSSVVFARPM